MKIHNKFKVICAHGIFLFLLTLVFPVHSNENFTYYVLDPKTKTGDLSVTSLFGKNIITIQTPDHPPQTITVNNHETRELSEACNAESAIACVLKEGTKISGTAPFSIGGGAIGTDMPNPEKYKGKLFSFPQLSNFTHRYFVYSPSSDANITIQLPSFDTTAQPYPISLEQGKWTQLDDNASTNFPFAVTGIPGTTIIRSDSEILVYVDRLSSYTNKYSAFPVVPASTSLWGVSSQFSMITATEDTTVTVNYGGTVPPASLNLSAGEMSKINFGAGSHGAGFAVHITSHKPINAVQYADGDGRELSSYLPDHLLDTHYAIPTSSQYIVAVCPTPNTVVTINDGTYTEQQDCYPNAVGEKPGKAYFGDNSYTGTGSFDPGALISSNHPIYLMYENQNNAEHNIAGYRNKQKNVLMIIADDLGAEVLGKYGMRKYQTGHTSVGDPVPYPLETSTPLTEYDYPPTPTLDSLIETGVMFRKAWSYPICSPTRATIQTGRHGYQTGVLTVNDATYLKLDEWTIPEVLDANPKQEYKHALFGKWHLGNSNNGSNPGDPADAIAINSGVIEAGYDTYAGTFYGAVHVNSNNHIKDLYLAETDYYNWYKTSSVRNDQGGIETSIEKVIEGETAEGVSAYALSNKVDDAIKWIAESKEDDKPWFVMLPLNAPHWPFHAPPDNLHTFSALKDMVEFDSGFRKQCLNDNSATNYPKLCYKAMVQAMDTELGRLLNSMTQEQRDNTTVIFVGDDGTPNQSAIYEPDSPDAKGTLYEGGIHVPLIISGAGIVNPVCDNGTALSSGNCESNELVSTVDLFNTTIGLMGASVADVVPNTLDASPSVNFVPVMQGVESDLRQTIFSERIGEGPAVDGKTVRNKRFKLMRAPYGDKNEKFYDLDQEEKLIFSGAKWSCDNVNYDSCNEAFSAYQELDVEISQHHLYCNECTSGSVGVSCYGSVQTNTCPSN